MSGGQGIRSTVVIESPGDCPLASVSKNLNGPIRSIRTSIPPSDGTPVALEFLTDETITQHDGLASVFSIGGLSIYRAVHDGATDCPCTCLGRHDTPISRIVAEDGTLTLVFHTPTFDKLQTIMGDLQENFPGLDVRRLIREPRGRIDREYAIVDAGELTDRQLELLELAYDRGYFERPRRVNATELADEVGIDPSTFREHLTVGLRKILDDVLLDRNNRQ